MINREKTIELYKKYGFKHRKSSSGNYFLGFTYKTGFFNNAELVSLIGEDKEKVELEMNDKANELEKLGFSTKKTFYSSFNEIETQLFKGFFNVSQWKKNIKHEYESFINNILKSLPDNSCKYKYINSPYIKNSKKGESKIVEEVCNGLNEKGAELTIIEAPAGFGKTSTSYEILNWLLENTDYPIPFFTEFSRDRQAQVFSHILIREVDRSFTSVNSDLVIEQVKKGRIIIVLDGFDELLHESANDDKNNQKENFESTEPMLETISELLTDNSKVILTSRRSAIFDGELFNEWVDKYADTFRINRYRIESPNITDWLDDEKIKKLKKVNIQIEDLANPVLLTFLRSINIRKLKKLCETPKLIVEHYFESMLEREIDRQNLRMSVDQQNKLFKLIAQDMSSNDYTTISKEALISFIKEKAKDILQKVRESYSAQNRPTIDKLSNTLSNHAFFDKSSYGENNIEFINEFVFGNYIGLNILEFDGNWIASDERFVEPAVNSYIARDWDTRKRLWKKLESINEFLEPSIRHKFEAQLTRVVNDNSYDGVDISSLNLKNIKFFKKGSINKSIYHNCTFTNCIFYLENFNDVTFLNCTFWNCLFEFHEISEQSIQFYNCKDNTNVIQSYEESFQDDEQTEKPDVQKYILTKIWPLSQPSLRRIHYFLSNLFQTDEFTKKELIKGIKELKSKEILIDAHDSNFIQINKHKINEFKKIQGRSE
ncbi:MAG: hypothetical protein DWP95_10495 [Proteobacteria bacterium]|nr:MAG: hypothetical protein DWP95_10495 [Pseudomonadota bacterium]